MFISVHKSNNKYSFEIGDGEFEDKSSFFSSLKDHHLFSLCPKTFPSFGEAYRCAQKVIENVPSCIMAKKLSFYKKYSSETGISNSESGVDETRLSVQEQIVEHYGMQLDLIENRFEEVTKSGVEPEEKEIEAVKTELDMIIDGIKNTAKEIEFEDSILKNITDIYNDCEELKKKIEKATSKKDVKTASKEVKGIDVKDILMTFGESVLLTLNKKDPEIYIKELSMDSKSNNYHFVFASNEKNIIGLTFNKDLLLSEVIPLNSNKLYDKKFFDEYWLPSVWSVGHIFIPEKNMVACSKNIHRDGNNIVLSGFDIKSHNKSLLKLSFKQGNDRIKNSWWIKVSQDNSEGLKDVAKDKMIGKEVKCIDKDLPTYYGRTGSVVDFEVGIDYADVVVDFRRGLDKVVLRDDQLEGFDLL